MSKINQILGEWQQGDVHTLTWFLSRGVQQRTAFKYSESGALKKIGVGVFARPLDRLSWLGAIRAMQEELELKVHVGAKSALELQGSAHNLQLAARPELNLIMAPTTSIPKWVKSNDWGVELQLSRSNLIKSKQELVKFTDQGITIQISSREQAILELLNTLDFSNGFETAENYLTSLFNIRPKVMQELLERCNSVKVKRVFLFLAETMDLPVFKNLDIAGIDLGKGKRVIVKSGRFDPKYQITVPLEKSEDESVF